MKIEHAGHSLTVGGALSMSYEGHIPKGNSAKIIRMLREGIYSDYVGSLVREILSNGYDAHVAVGIDRPVEITLPDVLSPYLRFRDYGPGMSESFMQYTYTEVGTSTKELDNRQIGARGIGRLTPFLYCDNYTVICYQQGTQWTWSIALCENDGIAVTPMYKGPTDEADGTEIVISFSSTDKDKLTSSLEKWARFFEPLPKIIAAPQRWQLTSPEYAVQGDGWGILKERGYRRSSALIGGLCYPIDRGIPGVRELDNLLADGLVLRFDIGELEITASREALSYNTKTIDAIRSRAQVVYSQRLVLLQQAVRHQPDLWQAIRTRSSQCRILSLPETVAPTWVNAKGKPYTLSGGNRTSLDPGSLSGADKRISKVLCLRETKEGNISASLDPTLDLDSDNILCIYSPQTHYKKIAKHLIDEGKCECLYAFCIDLSGAPEKAQTLRQWLDEETCPLSQCNPLILDEVELPKVERVIQQKIVTTVPHSRGNVKVLEWVGTTVRSSPGLGHLCKEVSIPKEEPILYMKQSRGVIEARGNSNDPVTQAEVEDLRQALSGNEKYQGKKPELYLIPSSMTPLPHWKNIYEEILETLPQITEVCLCYYQRCYTIRSIVDDQAQIDALRARTEKLDQESPMRTYILVDQEYNTLRDKNQALYRRAHRFLGTIGVEDPNGLYHPKDSAPDPRVRLAQLSLVVQSRYPLIRLCNRYISMNYMIDYIKGIDLLRAGEKGVGSAIVGDAQTN